MIYIVEDDKDIREMERYALKNSGFDVKTFESGKDFFAGLATERPDIVLLDIMLPGEDGLKILKKLRDNADTAGTAVIMVTAKDSELDKVKGLDMGADDYITKPFGIMELVSRVKAILRRTSQEADEFYTCGSIVLNNRKRTVTVQGEKCILTFKEFELLKYLIKNKGIALTREKLLEKVWGYDYEGETRTVDMHIKTIRKKLGDSADLIKTIRNIGYKMEE